MKEEKLCKPKMVATKESTVNDGDKIVNIVEKLIVVIMNMLKFEIMVHRKELCF